jgi:hypothetical protein
MKREPSSLRLDSNVRLWVFRDSDHWQIATNYRPVLSSEIVPQVEGQSNCPGEEKKK